MNAPNPPQRDIAGSELRNKLAKHFSYNHDGVSNDGYANADYVIELIQAHDTEKKQQLLAALPHKLELTTDSDPSYVHGQNDAVDQFTKAVEEVYNHDR